MDLDPSLVLRPVPLPPHYDTVLARSHELQFTMNSDVLTGGLLRTLVAAKPGGRILELGTGCGLGTTWLLDGLDTESTLISVDNDERVQGVARSILGEDRRVSFCLEDGGAFLSRKQDIFDLIYADAWPGKFSDLDLALSKVRPGGIYVVDDLLPQPNWPDGHAPKVSALIAQLETRAGFLATKLAWASGLMILVRVRSGS